MSQDPSLVDVAPDISQLAALRSGIDIGKGEVTRPARVDVLRADRRRGASPRITLDEGKNRRIRRMISAVGLSVLKRSGRHRDVTSWRASHRGAYEDPSAFTKSPA